MRPRLAEDLPHPQPVKRLRVLMILQSHFTQKGGGGAESQLRTIALHLKKLRHQVTIMTPMVTYGPQIPVERCYGLPVGRVRYPHMRVLGGVVMNLKFAAFLWQNRKRYDAWHVHIGHHLGAIACLVGGWIKKPVVVKISGWWELEQGLLQAKPGPYDLLTRRWLKRASVVQAISTRIADELVKRGFPSERILVLPNAVDTRRFRAHTARRAAGQPFVGVFVGRLVPEKGLTTLLDGWAAAFGGRKDVRLKLVGNGPMEEPLRQQAASLGITEQVEFLGHRDRVEDVLAEAHVGILPSRIEGLSNTLLEFMACGLPSLASRVSGSEDFVKPGRNGWLFDVSDAARLALGLREAESLPSEKLAEMGQNARADVEAAASLEHVVGRLLQLYQGAHPRELEG
jgi:glycosyltransferase involved in cell wall biosynthesis